MVSLKASFLNCCILYTRNLEFEQTRFCLRSALLLQVWYISDLGATHTAGEEDNVDYYFCQAQRRRVPPCIGVGVGVGVSGTPDGAEASTSSDGGVGPEDFDDQPPLTLVEPELEPGAGECAAGAGGAAGGGSLISIWELDESGVEPLPQVSVYVGTRGTSGA